MNKISDEKKKNICVFIFLILYIIVIIIIIVTINQNFKSHKSYKIRKKEDNDNYDINYNHKKYLTGYKNKKYNDDNLEESINRIVNETKNKYKNVTINYSNISTGYHKIYNSSFNYQKFKNYLVYQLNFTGFEEIELSDIEQRFLNGLICFFKPQKILEIGVSKGGSSALILNAIQNINGSFLYSMDINKKNYIYNRKDTGFLVDEKYSYLKQKWKLYTGDIPCEFIEEVGGNIDFVFIDTVHVLPGEFLNFLEVFPFLKKNAIVVLHDISQIGMRISSNDRLFSILKGIKIIPIQENESFVSNIGAVILDEDINDRLFDVFFGIYTSWSYYPPRNQINKLTQHFVKYYGEKYINVFKEAYIKNTKSKIGQRISRNLLI